MKDSIIKGTGNSRKLRTSLPEGTTWEEALQLLIAGEFPIDLAGIDPDGFDVVGTPLNVQNLLSHEVETLLGLDHENSTVSNALKALRNPLHMYRTNYIGDGTTANNTRTFQVPGQPVVLFIVRQNTNSDVWRSYLGMRTAIYGTGTAQSSITWLSSAVSVNIAAINTENAEFEVIILYDASRSDAEMNLTVTASNGQPVPDCTIYGLVDSETGNYAVTNSNGQATGTYLSGSTIKIDSPFVDLLSQEFEGPSGDVAVSKVLEIKTSGSVTVATTGNVRFFAEHDISGEVIGGGDGGAGGGGGGYNEFGGKGGSFSDGATGGITNYYAGGGGAGAFGGSYKTFTAHITPGSYALTVGAGAPGSSGGVAGTTSGEYGGPGASMRGGGGTTTFVCGGTTIASNGTGKVLGEKGSNGKQATSDTNPGSGGSGNPGRRGLGGGGDGGVGGRGNYQVSGGNVAPKKGGVGNPGKSGGLYVKFLN